MADRPLFSSWCVMIKPRRGAWWSAPHYSGRTRAEAIHNYIGLHRDNPMYAEWRKSYDKDVRRGDVKCVRYFAIVDKTAAPEVG